MRSRALAAFAALAVLPAGGCSLFVCENNVVSEAMRPGGPYRAVTFIRNCGATTAFSTHVSILGIKRFSDSETGNVFIGEGGDTSQPRVSVRWVDRDVLEISDLGITEVFKAEPRWDSIQIEYVSHVQ